MNETNLEQENLLGTAKISKLLCAFAVPSIISMVVNALYNIVDQIFIGQGVGYLGNGATNVVLPLTIIVIALSLLLGDGAAAYLSLKLGEGDNKSAAKGVGNAITAIVIMGIALCAIFLIFLKPLCYLFGATDEILPYALDYGRIISLKNHIIRSATLEAGFIKNGRITDELKEIYTELSEKECSLIITGMMGVGHNSCIFPEMARIDREDFVEILSDIVTKVHSNGGKLAVQLGHCGKDSAVIDYGEYAFSPSDYVTSDGIKAKEMTQDEIALVIREFGKAAKKCKLAGADGIEIHSAHGYLLSQFLSPYYNKRTDKYGGDIANRARFLFEVYHSIRKEIGNDFPVLIKLNASDLIDNGFDVEDCIWVCNKLGELGADGVEISAGLAVNQNTVPFQKVTDISTGSFTKMTERIADSVNIPIISVGGYRSLKTIENILNTTNITAISMSRPFICESNLIERWTNGDDKPSHCISCNQCLEGMFGCVMKKKL